MNDIIKVSILALLKKMSSVGTARSDLLQFFLNAFSESGVLLLICSTKRM